MLPPAFRNPYAYSPSPFSGSEAGARGWPWLEIDARCCPYRCKHRASLRATWGRSPGSLQQPFRFANVAVIVRVTLLDQASIMNQVFQRITHLLNCFLPDFLRHFVARPFFANETAIKTAVHFVKGFAHFFSSCFSYNSLAIENTTLATIITHIHITDDQKKPSHQILFGIFLLATCSFSGSGTLPTGPVNPYRGVGALRKQRLIPCLA